MPDTCFLLDVIRDPTRPVVRPPDRAAAVTLADALSTSTNLVGFIADQVHTEFQEHRTQVEQEAAGAIEKLADRVTRMDQVLAAYGGGGTSAIGHLRDHGARARAVLDRWLAASLTATEGDGVARRAVARMNLGRTPARKGHPSAKDCVVIETYLDLAAQLRREGHTAPIVFASSNTKDFCEPPGSTLKSDLAAEFAALKMDFAPNFGAAKFSLGV